MNDGRPFMLVRARAKATSRPEFDRWFDRVHLKDIAKIPGIEAVLQGRIPDGTRLAVYSFESTDAIQPALASPEASYSRGTWERWQPDLEELLIELWSPALPIRLYQSIN